MELEGVSFDDWVMRWIDKRTQIYYCISPASICFNRSILLVLTMWNALNMIHLNEFCLDCVFCPK